MSIITQLDRHTGLSETTLNGVVNSEATYEIIDGILIIRTTTNDTIHITRDIGKKLVDIINSELI
jgi:predicted polyphosphate/ATP-dependent NAD kinase